MPKSNSSDLFGGNFWSKLLFLCSFLFLCLTGITLMSKMQTYDPISKEILSSETPWKTAVLLFILALVTGFIAYRLAGGKRNPAIWEGKDLYDLLKHTALSGHAKIGFHSLRDQNLLLSKLESIGIRKKLSQDIRQFIRDKIVTDRRAFDICRDNIVIQMIHNGKEWFWDGYGNKTTAQFFNEAEIIFDLNSSVDYIFSEAFEGLKAEPSKENP
jgi:hypothetical protein